MTAAVHPGAPALSLEVQPYPTTRQKCRTAALQGLLPGSATQASICQVHCKPRRVHRTVRPCSGSVLACAASISAASCRPSRRNVRKRLHVCAKAVAESTPDSGKPEDAVVKIFVTRQRASFMLPWQAQNVEASGGSGTFIYSQGSESEVTPADTKESIAKASADGNPPYWEYSKVSDLLAGQTGDFVLTAAHVIADARDVRVQLLSRDGLSPEKYPATVVAVAHDCDLALLEVSNPECFAGITPMELLRPQELPAVQSRVQVMGFPIGGDYLSITEGVVSRIEVVDYSHSRRHGLALTVDAAINAGNSGGPLVDPVTGKLVGVAHQKVVGMGIENQGHAVPTSIIWRFLHGSVHGHLLSMPSLGIYVQTLESPAHREFVGLRHGETGSLIREVYYGPGESSNLQPGDVLLKVGKYVVDNFGAVQFMGHRVPLSVAQDLCYIGDSVRVTVRRDGQDQDMDATLRSATHLVQRHLYGEANFVEPPFFISAGLVFSPLTTDLLEQTWPRAEDRPPHLMDLYVKGEISTSRTEAVLLLSILADDINAGYGSGYVGCPVVTGVNGHDIVDLADLMDKLTHAVKEAEFVEVDFDMSIGPYTILLKSADIAEADARIQDLYGLPALKSSHFITPTQAENSDAL